ncbi:CDGSH iron-sulfur domain-containing protein [Kribbella sp. NPDC002412]
MSGGYRLFMTPKNDSATEIRAYPDGPILVRGDFLLLDEDGEPMPAQRRTIALCRCGRTAIAPFCDGTHAFLKR